MIIGDAITSALPVFRANAESLMTGSCSIHREVSAWDEDEQRTVTTWAAVAAVTRCHVEISPVGSRSMAGGESVSAETPLVKVPWTVAGVEPDDRVTVAGMGDPLWVTHATHDDPSHPVELLLSCRRLR